MCLIIETKQDILIPSRVMDNMFARNDDGYGFMYIKDGEAHGEKYQGKSKEELYEKYLELREYEPYIHLRMKTHGDINPEQSHPFYCGHGIWMMHNGVINNTQGNDLSKSDTWYMANKYLWPVFDHAKDPEALLLEPAFHEFIHRFIGGSNRVVFLSKNIKGLRFNNSAWHVINNEETECVGMRVSNTYAWSMHTKIAPVVVHANRGGVQYIGGQKVQYSNHRDGDGRIIVPPGFAKTESLAGDPDGSFRDSHGKLWVYTGRGWMMADRYWELFPEKKGQPLPTIAEGLEATQANPTLQPFLSDSAKTDGNGSSKSIIVVGNVSSNGSLPTEPRKGSKDTLYTNWQDDEYDAYTMDAYQDWLYAEWKPLPYEDIVDRVKEEPEEAADIIASLLGTKIKIAMKG